MVRTTKLFFCCCLVALAAGCDIHLPADAEALSSASGIQFAADAASSAVDEAVIDLNACAVACETAANCGALFDDMGYNGPPPPAPSYFGLLRWPCCGPNPATPNPLS